MIFDFWRQLREIEETLLDLFGPEPRLKPWPEGTPVKETNEEWNCHD